MNPATKRNTIRSLLLLHFIGLTLVLGTRFSTFVMYQVTGAGALQTIALGRDLGGLLARRLTLPGFLLTIVTGIALVLIRYGRRPPLWVWLKVGLTTAALSIATPLVGPALESARVWAHWSVEHGHLAPQFSEYAARASLIGNVVILIFLSIFAVAIWKPTLAVKPYRARVLKSPPAVPTSLPDEHTTKEFLR